MKLFILSADASGQVDPTVQNNLIKFLPEQVTNVEEADAILVPISWFPNYQFNQALLEMTKPFILLDFMEPHTSQFSYDLFDAWFSEHRPILHLKRELFGTEVTRRRRPIEFPCYLPVPPTVSREEFDARPLTVFFSWGHSHRMRPEFHAAMFQAMANDGIDVVSHWDQLTSELPRATTPRWAAFYTPYWNRRPIEDTMAVQQTAKISVSLWGNGQKCFRSTEAPVGSLVALPRDQLAWSHPWDGHNSIQIDPDYPFASLKQQLKTLALYPIYVECQENIRRYESAHYVRDYVIPAIQECL